MLHAIIPPHIDMKNPGYIFIFIQITHIQTEEQREDARGCGEGGKEGEGDLQKMGTLIGRKSRLDQ